MKEVRILFLSLLKKCGGTISICFILERIYTKSGLVSGLSFGQKLRLFWRLIKKDDIDIYHFFFKPTSLVAMAAKIALKFNNKKTIQTVVSVPAEGEQLGKAIFADLVVVGSQFMQKRLAKEGIETKHIPFGVNTGQLTELCDVSDAKKAFGLKGMPVILFAGNLHPGRGIEVVAGSVEDVVKQFPEVKFVFANRFFETKLEKQNLAKIKSGIYEKNLTGNVMFLGIVENMKQLIKAADIVVFPPNAMVFKMDYPLILLEAMSMAKPVIFSNVSPLDELFESQSNIMIERNNPKQLSAAIISLLSHKEKMCSMGENARDLIEKKFNIQLSTHKYLEMYEELLKK